MSPLPDPAPPYPRIELHDLVNISRWQDRIPWRPFAEGVEIHRLHGDGVAGPAAALLRYAPGGRVRLHEHADFEHILVLSGSQRDQNGVTPAGSLVINPPGTRHSIVSDDGCIALAIYACPAKFLAQD